MSGGAEKSRGRLSTAGIPPVPDPAFRKKVRTGLITALCVIAVIAAVYFSAVGIYKAKLERTYPKSAVNYKGTTVCERFIVPEGFSRTQYTPGSYPDDIRNIKLKNFGLGVYNSAGGRISDAPLWGVIDGNAAAETAEKYGSGKFLLIPVPAKAGGAIGAGDVYPGCFCGVKPDNGGAQDYIMIGTVLDVCRAEDGRTLVILASSYDAQSDVYVLSAPGDAKTAWIDASETGLLTEGAYGAEAVFFEYGP